MNPVQYSWLNKTPSEILDINNPLVPRLAFISEQANSCNSDFLGKRAPDLISAVIDNLDLNSIFNIAFFRSALLIIMSILNGLISEIDITKLPGYICEMSSLEVIRLTLLSYPNILDVEWYKNIAFCRTKKEMSDVIGSFVNTVLPNFHGPDLTLDNFQLFIQKLHPKFGNKIELVICYPKILKEMFKSTIFESKIKHDLAKVLMIAHNNKNYLMDLFPQLAYDHKLVGILDDKLKIKNCPRLSLVGSEFLSEIITVLENIAEMFDLNSPEAKFLKSISDPNSFTNDSEFRATASMIDLHAIGLHTDYISIDNFGKMFSCAQIGSIEEFLINAEKDRFESLLEKNFNEISNVPNKNIDLNLHSGPSDFQLTRNVKNMIEEFKNFKWSSHIRKCVYVEKGFDKKCNSNAKDYGLFCTAHDLMLEPVILDVINSISEMGEINKKVVFGKGFSIRILQKSITETQKRFRNNVLGFTENFKVWIS